MTPDWLVQAVTQRPERFPALVAIAAFGEGARLRGPSSLAAAEHDVLAVDPGQPPVLTLAGPGLGGAMSPLPAAMAAELAALDPACAAAGLVQLIEDRLLRLDAVAGLRRAVDDPTGHVALVSALAGAGPVPWIGRLVDGPTADAVATRLALVSGCRVRVIPMAGGELPLAPHMGAVLGRTGLGADSALGTAVRARELGVLIELGPVDARAVADLRPGGSRHAALLAALADGLPACLRWRLEVLVDTHAAVGDGLGAARLAATVRLLGDPPPAERETLATG